MLELIAGGLAVEAVKEALKEIIKKIKNPELKAKIMDFENSVNPYENRKNEIDKWRKIAVIDIGVSEEIVALGNSIMPKRHQKKDALHLACAIKSKCDYFLTTDKKVLNKNLHEIIIMNPLDFVRKLEV